MGVSTSRKRPIIADDDRVGALLECPRPRPTRGAAGDFSAQECSVLGDKLHKTTTHET
jgi:hypothetical protein